MRLGAAGAEVWAVRRPPLAIPRHPAATTQGETRKRFPNFSLVGQPGFGPHFFAGSEPPEAFGFAGRRGYNRSRPDFRTGRPSLMVYATQSGLSLAG